MTCADGFKKGEDIQETEGKLFKCTEIVVDDVKDDNLLSTPVIIGIAVGIVAVLAIGGGIAAFFICKSKKVVKSDESS